MELPQILFAIAVLVACTFIIIRRKAGIDADQSDQVANSEPSYQEELENAPNEDARLTILRAEAQRILDESSKDPMMKSYNQIDEFLDKHIDTLWAKKRQMTFTDDYGQEITDKFEAELDYFVKRVIPPGLLQEYISSFPFDQDPSECAKGIVREKLKWHNRTMNRRRDEAIERGESVEKELVYRSDCNGVAFEQLVKLALEARGYKVRSTPVTGDQGVDLLADSDGVTIAVQCKRSSSPLGNKAIQEVAAGKVHYQVDEAWVVSDADFTTGARSLASTNGVKLVNFFTL